MDPEAVIAELEESAAPIGELKAPARPGVYALVLTRDGALPSISASGSGPLYIGTSKNLAEREFDTHFASGKSGFSTVRRSLGALLREELNLQPEPRGPGLSKNNFTNYRFDAAGEKRLTEWMRAFLDVGVRADPQPEALERELIGLACPPLNLTLWANPDAAAIKASRKACADIARSLRST